MYGHKLRHDEIPTVPKDWKRPREDHLIRYLVSCAGTLTFMVQGNIGKERFANWQMIVMSGRD